MAAGAWTFYTKGKRKLLNGVMPSLSTGSAWRLSLHKSTSNAASAKATASLLGSIDNQVASVSGYSTSGMALTAEKLSASGSGWRFEASVPVITAVGSPIGSVMYAVIYASGASAGACHVLCYSQLSTGVFTVGAGNTLTISTTNAIFSLV